MPKKSSNYLFMVALVTLMSPWSGIAQAIDAVDFNRDIRPLLADRCFHCHGPDENRRQAGLRLDLEKDAKDHAIAAGNPEASELITRIVSTDDEERMPPPDSGKQPLTPAEATLFRRWIEQGADWDEHWAFRRIAGPPTPEVKDGHWAANDIDHFVLARLEAAGIKPSPEAARTTLIRRLAFDLIGLPPTLDEIDAFVNDPSPKAYEKLVDRLLASPHYGERMAIDWLDGARYADTNGFQNDFTRNMWP